MDIPDQSQTWIFNFIHFKANKIRSIYIFLTRLFMYAKKHFHFLCLIFLFVSCLLACEKRFTILIKKLRVYMNKIFKLQARDSSISIYIFEIWKVFESGNAQLHQLIRYLYKYWAIFKPCLNHWVGQLLDQIEIWLTRVSVEVELEIKVEAEL